MSSNKEMYASFINLIFDGSNEDDYQQDLLNTLETVDEDNLR